MAKQAPFRAAPRGGKYLYWYDGTRPMVWKRDKPLLEAQLKHGNPLAKINITKSMVDPATFVGIFHPKFTTAHYEEKGTRLRDRIGGLGSKPFRLQKLGEGVENVATTPVNYKLKPSDKGVIKGIPPRGGVYYKHTHPDGITTDNVAGAKPGSVAAKRLKGRRVVMGKNGFFVFRKL